MQFFELSLQPLQFTAASILRIEGDKSVSENDVIFCNPMYWIAKNDIVFAYRQEWRPAAASGNLITKAKSHGSFDFFFTSGKTIIRL
jgi:hypothetical protein